MLPSQKYMLKSTAKDVGVVLGGIVSATLIQGALHLNSSNAVALVKEENSWDWYSTVFMSFIVVLLGIGTAVFTMTQFSKRRLTNFIVCTSVCLAVFVGMGFLLRSILLFVSDSAEMSLVSYLIYYISCGVAGFKLGSYSSVKLSEDQHYLQLKNREYYL